METVTIAYSQEWFSRSKLYSWELITGHLRRATKLFFSAMKTVCRAVPPPHWWNQGPETRSEFLSSPGQCQASSYSLFSAMSQELEEGCSISPVWQKRQCEREEAGWLISVLSPSFLLPSFLMGTWGSRATGNTGICALHLVSWILKWPCLINLRGKSNHPALFH